MSERSQLYVRVNDREGISLAARDNAWNYSERMISRCRWTMEWLRDNIFIDMADLNRILDVNFDMKDIVISSDLIKEHREVGYSRDFEDYVFWSPENCNGKLFIDVTYYETPGSLEEQTKIRYAFTDGEIEKVMTAKEYMDWNCKDWNDEAYPELDEETRKTVLENLAFISDNATLMTMEELQEFIEHDYIAEMNKNKKQQTRKVLIEGEGFDWVLLCTDAPRDTIGKWCEAAVRGGFPFDLFVDGLTGGKEKMKILSSSVYNDDRSDTWIIGVDECYSFDDYVQEKEEEKDER